MKSRESHIAVSSLLLIKNCCGREKKNSHTLVITIEPAPSVMIQHHGGRMCSVHCVRLSGKELVRFSVLALEMTGWVFCYLTTTKKIFTEKLRPSVMFCQPSA